jgi:hypothetical protein
MASKTIYKKITLVQSQTRTLTTLDETKKTKVNTVVSNFIQYLKNAHS